MSGGTYGRGSGFCVRQPGTNSRLMRALLRIVIMGYVIAIWFDVPLGGLGVTTGQCMAIAVPGLLFLWLQSSGIRVGPLSGGGLPVALGTIGLVFILAGSLLSAFQASDWTPVVDYFLRYMLGGLTVLAVYVAFRGEGVPSRVIRIIVLAAAAMSAMVCLGLIFPSIAEWIFDRPESLVRRAQGFNAHPNQLAMLVTAACPLAVSLVANSTRSWTTIGVLAVMLVAVVVTGSRANIVLAFALSLGMGLVVLLGARTKWEGLKVASALAALASTATWFALQIFPTVSPRAWEAFQRMTSVGGAEISEVFGPRSVLYATAWEEFTRSPWFGIGAGNAREVLSARHAHNILLETALTTGLVGLIGMTIFLGAIGMLLWILITGRGAHSDSPAVKILAYALALGTASYITSNMISDSFGGVTVRLLWVYLGIILVVLDARGHRTVSGDG